MNLPDPIPVLIARPLLYGVLDRSMLPCDPPVSAPLVGMDRCFATRVAVNVGYQGLLVGVFGDSQPYLPSASAHTPYYRWAVVAVGAVPAPFVGASSGRIFGVWVALTFFPPRFETSRRSRRAHPL